VAPLLVEAPGQPLPLRKIYILRPGPELAIEPLTPTALTRLLIAHWYGLLYAGEMFASDREARPIAFHQAAGVARRTPAAWLLARREWEGLAGLDEIIREDLARLPLISAGS